jgi:predicted RNase H-like HicB family nuclease
MSKREIVFRVPIDIEPDEDGFHAYCSCLKGLHVGGKTEEEARAFARDAAIAYIESLIKHGDPIPLSPVTVKPRTSNTRRSFEVLALVNAK